MKYNFRVALILVALSLPFVNMPENLAQIPGGYNNADKTDQDVVKAAKFAFNTQRLKQRRSISLISIERAEMQVVAGRNYQLWLKVKNNNQIQQVTTVVYLDLQQRYSLSSWKVEKCKR
ncbi:hypothetical protein Cri9333_3850 [Crinalium epipsammum PCC 9333]|uniref:Cystatin domain-containing protein n=1 Tax=Crinalium epipsammum PCC 9333 TaxID=1173022 RepID=K9W4D5_9CYAN|nr:cystatin domain-containing protein [Crinalium epipsammum]AFZ14659.1 hypothetical protein Cri9333_3850 [Crinalium epipsammum PCC 9333]